MTTEHLVVTGRSGAGVSTTAVNISAALAEQGHRVAHLGYDRHRFSSYLLRGQSPLKAACGDGCQEACDVGKFHCAGGFREILCIECGDEGEGGMGGEGGEGAEAGEAGTAQEFSAPGRMALVSRFNPDFVVHDIAGEPDALLPLLRNQGASTRIFLVTSASFASLTTLNRHLGALGKSGETGSRFGGIIANDISGSFFGELVDDFARAAGTRPLVMVPHSLMVSVAEYGGQTVIESAPGSHLSSVYRKLARLVVKEAQGQQPTFVDADAFAAWRRKWREIIEELESGMVRDGAAI